MWDTQAIIERKLFADSGGYCQNPNCNIFLFEEWYEIYDIAEKAHIVAKKDNWPRGNDVISEENRESYENKILLCPNCHTKIDKVPEDYPEEMLLTWKKNHTEKIKGLFWIKKVGAREEACSYLEPIFLENKTIFDEYWPESEYSEDPSNTRWPETWREKIKKTIIPNNRRILLFISNNFDLLQDKEKKEFALFQQHVDDFETKYIFWKDYHLQTFPKNIVNIFKS